MASTLIDVLQPLSSKVPALVSCTGVLGGTDTQLSRSQVFALAQQTARELHHPNRKVFALHMKNSMEFVICFLAIAGAGHVVTPLNPQIGEHEAKEVFHEAKVDCLILDTDDMLSPVCKAAAAFPTLDVFVMRPTFEVKSLKVTSTAALGATFKVFPSCQPSDVALYLFTSGTTSKPKLVPLTHHNMMTSIGNIRNTYELDEGDVSYVVMPLFHIHGLQSALFAALLGGGTVLLPSEGKFSATVFWRDVLLYRATWYTAVPTIHQILLSRKEEVDFVSKPHALRFVRSCSSPLAPAVLQQLQTWVKVPVLEAYAMTEASHQICSNPLPHLGKAKSGSVGRPTNVQIKILPTGEVCIRGDNVAKGYINVSNEDVFASGNWFKTGDLGYLDEDGYLFLVGRSKEMVNRGGEKISPFEIDSALLEMPRVKEAVCFALPSEKYGEELCAAIVGSVTEQQVLEFCQARLTKVKVPSRVFVVDAIPKSATGKVQRRNLTTYFLPKIGRSKL